MKRKWFKKEGDLWVEAPPQKDLYDRIIFNYNCDSNEEMLRKDGYIPEDELN